MLTWATYGVHAGTLFKREGKYNIGRNNCGLRLKSDFDKNINLDYIRLIAEPLFKKVAKGAIGFHRSLPQVLVKDIEIPIPTNATGEINAEKQKEIVEKYEFVDDINLKIAEYQKRIDELTVEIEQPEQYKKIAIVDETFFELKRGKRITKETIDFNKGNIPVYSSSKDKDNVLGMIDENYLIKNNLILYNAPSILFNLDGSVGYCFLRTDDKYSFIDVVASLKPKTENIDLVFLLYELRKEIRKTGANYQSKLYFNKILDYGIAIKFPIDKKGNLDINKQKEIADKYYRIEEIKRAMKSAFEKISQSNIDV
jgi:hypothetical protein